MDCSCIWDLPYAAGVVVKRKKKKYYMVSGPGKGSIKYTPFAKGGTEAQRGRALIKSMAS